MKREISLLVLGFALFGCLSEEIYEDTDVEHNATVIENEPSFGLSTNTIVYEPYPLAFYNVFYEQGLPDITFELNNTGEIPLTIRLSAEYLGYSYNSISTVDLAPGESKVVNMTISLMPEKIEQIKTKTKFALHYKIEYEKDGQWKTFDEDTKMIDVYPVDTAVLWMQDSSGEWYPLYEYLAVFVTPKSDAVQELLAKAIDYHPYHSLVGYQCNGCNSAEWEENTNEQVKAIYDALKYEYHVRYLSMTTAFGSETDIVQRVNLPDETLRLGTANCLDGTLLFASALEAIGINPYIVILPGHAFVAWDIREDGRFTEALETTLIGYADFEEALDEGNRELDEHWSDLTDGDYTNGEMISIKEAREVGILPLR